jgi:hypothetical protein
VIVNNNEDLCKYLNNNEIEVTDFEQLNDDAIMLIYKAKDEHVVENSSSNQIIALWTTSHARISLAQGMYRVLEGRPDARIIYLDTDSLLYEFDEELGDPMLELSGDHLGQWKEEYEDYVIIEYVSGGAKAYAIWLKNKKTGADKYIMRCRGITLDYR